LKSFSQGTAQGAVELYFWESSLTPARSNMSGRTVFSTPVIAALLACLAIVPEVTAQTVGADEAPGASAAQIALSPAQKRAIYAIVFRQRLRTSAANIPLTVGATVPRSTVLLTLPDEAQGKDLQRLKYATVDDNVVLVDPISMRVIDVIRSFGP